MPFRCPGPHARYTDELIESIHGAWSGLLGRALDLARKGGGIITNARRAGDRPLEPTTTQLLVSNEEFLVSASHQLALITSLPFVHTARRSYRLNGPVKFSEGLGSPRLRGNSESGRPAQSYLNLTI
jgi:hypothetical protein